MTARRSASTALRVALAVGTGLTAMTISASPALAAELPRTAPTAYCQPNQCDPYAGNDSGGGFTSPGGRQASGPQYGVSHNIGKGQQDFQRNRPRPALATPKR